MPRLSWLARLIGQLSQRSVQKIRGRGRISALTRVASIVQPLETRRMLAANIAVTNAYLVDSSNNPLASVSAGENVYVHVDLTTTDLPSNASYKISFTVNGFTESTGQEIWGAGVTGTNTWFAYWGAFVVAPGANQITVNVDPDQSVSETSYADNLLTISVNASTPPVGNLTYSVAQIRSAYGLNSLSNFGSATADGTGQTIAIVDEYNDPSIFTDLDGFDESMNISSNTSPTLYQSYGASSSFLSVYNQTGVNITSQIASSGQGSVPPIDPTGQWESEITLDVEWAHAIAPGAKIDLIETSGSIGALDIGAATAASLPGVSVVSMSWIGTEYSSETALDSSTFVTPSGHTGVSFLASVGDGGTPGGYPAFSPNVIAVGGTALMTNGYGYGSETGWSFPTPRTLNNGSSAYTQTGSWSPQSGGFSGNDSTAAAGSGNSATWTTTISSSDQGWMQGTEVSATWIPSAGNATNAQYLIYDGSATTGTLLGTVKVDQTKTPAGTVDGSSQFQELGVYYPTSGQLTVVLSGSGANGMISADAIGIAPSWATGGGKSSYETEPSYQTGVQSTGDRTTPDVAFDASEASGVTIWQSGAGFDAAGTSLACPCWAGIIAIVNQGRVANGSGTLNSGSKPTQVLQAIYSLPSADYHDVTSGYNGLFAGTGYDELTGRGSPIANLLIPDMVLYQSGIVPVVSVSDAGGVYTGSPYAASGTVTGTSGTPGTTLDGVGLTFTYYGGSTATGTPLSGAPTATGTYTVVARYAGSTDYASASNSTTFTITKATPIVAVTDAGGVFNATAFPATATVTGASGIPTSTLEAVGLTLTYYSGSTASGTPLSAAPTAVGTYTVVAAFAGSTDYASATRSATFAITRATPVIAVTDASGFYTGSPYTATATVAGVSGSPAATLEGGGLTLTYYGGSTASGTPLSGAPAAVGTYTVVAAFSGSTSYVSASNSTTFTIASSTTTFMDDTSPGFSKVGSWTKVTGAGFDSDYLYAPAGNGSSYAIWNFSGLTSGQYLISTTWASYSNRATNAPYTILSGVGGSVLANATINQQLTPSGVTDSGANWQSIGTVNVVGSALVVELTNQANNYVIADAIRIQRLGPVLLAPQTQVTDGATTIPNSTGSDSFGTVTIGSAAVTKSFTITNTGSANLILQPATVTASSAFSIVSNFAVGQIVAPGSTATLSVQMATATVGTQSATVSFASNDSTNSPFTFNVKGTVSAIIMDDTSPGFSTVGAWAKVAGTGFDSDYLYSPAGSGSTQALWNFSGLSSGQYLVSATWTSYSNRATNAPYTILSGVGGTVLATSSVNQQVAPSGVTDGGATWQTIGTVNVVGSTLLVKLTNQANNYVIADAIRIQRLGAVLTAPQTQVTDGATNIPNNTGSDSFGTVTVGSAAVTKSFTITNTGNANLVLQPATVTANSGFSIVSNFTAGQIVAPGGTATLSVQMATATVGTQTATVSFTSNDSTNSPLTFSLSGTVSAIIMDDTSAGFSKVGSWSKVTGSGFDSDYLYSPSGNGSSYAIWNFSGLAPGQYLISATWTPYSNRATNAPYTILNSVGGSVLASTTVNQQQNPSGVTDSGSTWQTIGTVNVVGSTLVVELTNQANNYVIADAIRIQRLGPVPA